MADTGWVSPGTMAQYVLPPGGNNWATRDNAKTQSDTYASSLCPKLTASEYLSAENFSFGIPAGSTILGIEARIEIFQSGTASAFTIGYVYIHKNGTKSGDSKGTGTTLPASDTDTYWEYGGAADMWNSGYNYSDITDSTFGLMISVLNGASATYTAYVDHMQVKITYTPPPGYGNDVNDVPSANIGSVNDVPTANIATVNDI